MTRTRIKICGIRDQKALSVAVGAGADAVGLVFAVGSPRHITAEQARALVREVPPFVEPVGLFVNESVQTVRAMAQEVGLATVQLHGNESPQYAGSLAPLRVIKAVPFDQVTSAATADGWRHAPVAALLWDAPAPAAAPSGERGGTGRRFDWSALALLAEDARPLPPMIVAGGLTPDNVAEVIAILRPFAVDVSSGVESSRGIKDAGLIRALCQAVREADSAA